jgi:hypothetical protein
MHEDNCDRCGKLVDKYFMFHVGTYGELVEDNHMNWYCEDCIVELAKQMLQQLREDLKNE